MISESLVTVHCSLITDKGQGEWERGANGRHNNHLTIKKPHRNVGRQSITTRPFGVPSLIQTITVGSGISPDRPEFGNPLSVIGLWITVYGLP